MTNQLKFSATCPTCNFSSRDVDLLNNHSCDIALQGNRCEDFPACGHEAGDCNGLLYGSDEAIKEAVHEAYRTGHGECDHQEGFYNCQGDDDYDEDYDEDEVEVLYEANRNRGGE